MEKVERTPLGYELPRSPFEREHANFDRRLNRVRPEITAIRRPVKLTDEERVIVGRSAGPAERWAQAYGVTIQYVYELRRRYKAGTL